MTRIIIQDQFYEFYREKIIEFDDEHYNCILEGKDYDDKETFDNLLDTIKHIVDRIYNGLEWLEDVRKFDDNSLGILLLLVKPDIYGRYAVKKVDDSYYISIVTDKSNNILFSNIICNNDKLSQLLDLLEEILDLIQYAKDKFNKV